MGLLDFRQETHKNEERKSDEDDEDFHAIFEIDDLVGSDYEDTEDFLLDPMNQENNTIEPSGRISETITGDTKPENPKVVTSDTLPGVKFTIEVYDQRLKSELKTAIIWNNKGVVLSKLGNYDEAIEAYDQALMIDPSYSGAWNNKGVVLSKLGKYSEAIEAYNQALAINPDYPA